MQYSREVKLVALDRLREMEEQREVARLLAQVAGYGEDTWNAGALWRFEKTFTMNSGEVRGPYQYAALKAKDNLWYLTGASSSGMKWPDFVLWLLTEGSAVTLLEIQVVENP